MRKTKTETCLNKNYVNKHKKFQIWVQLFFFSLSFVCVFLFTSYSFTFLSSCWTIASTVKRESFFNCSFASLYFCWYSHSVCVSRCCKTCSVTSKSWLKRNVRKTKDNKLENKSINNFVFNSTVASHSSYSLLGQDPFHTCSSIFSSIQFHFEPTKSNFIVFI